MTVTPNRQRRRLSASLCREQQSKKNVNIFCSSHSAMDGARVQTSRSPAEVATQLQRLRKLLSALPHSLPLDAGHYNFIGYQPDKELEEDFGSAAAVVNRALEITFCPLGRNTGVTLKERGQGLVAVVDVLETHQKEKSMGAVMEKWIDDLTAAAISAGAVIQRFSYVLNEADVTHLPLENRRLRP